MSENRKSGEGCSPRRIGIHIGGFNTEKIAQISPAYKDFRPSAAVLSETDPRAANLARVVPTDAKITRIGGAIIGYRKASPEKVLPRPSSVAAGQRFNELARLLAYRRRHGLALGPIIGWAFVLVDLVAAFGGQVDVQTVGDMARRIGGLDLDLDIVAGIASSKRLHMLDAAQTAAFLEVTSVEREDCGLCRIDAWDEPATERRRRLARDRQKRRRVTRTFKKDNLCGGDRARRVVASPRLRRLRSSSSCPRLLSSFEISRKVRDALSHPNRVDRQIEAPLYPQEGNSIMDKNLTATIIRLELWLEFLSEETETALKTIASSRSNQEATDVLANFMRQWARINDDASGVADGTVALGRMFVSDAFTEVEAAVVFPEKSPWLNFGRFDEFKVGVAQFFASIMATFPAMTKAIDNLEERTEANSAGWRVA